MSAGLSAGEEQRQALLDNTETLERTSARLTQGHKIALETEHIGAQILNDLHSQRQTLSHARQRVSVSVCLSVSTWWLFSETLCLFLFFSCTSFFHSHRDDLLCFQGCFYQFLV